METFLEYVKTLDESLFTALSKLPLDEYIEFNKTVELYMKMVFVPIHHRFDMIMNDIRKHLNNMTLILTDGELRVNQSIISIIPYFEYLFEHDTPDTSIQYVKIDFPVNVMKIIIEWVYFHTFDSTKIPINLIVDILNAMDVMLYHEFSEAMIKQLNKTIKLLICDYYAEQELDKLLLLEHLIYNLKIIHPTINIDISHFRICKKYICHFTHLAMFDPQEQYDAIIASGHYHHFNRSTVKPKKVLKALIDLCPESECFFDVMNCNKIVVRNEYFPIDHVKLNGAQEIIIIHSYQPVFHYTIYKKFKYPTHHLEIGSTEMFIELEKSLDIDVFSSTIVILNEKINFKDPLYNIKEMYRLFKNGGTVINTVPANSLKYCKNTDYLLILDEPLQTDHGLTYIVGQHRYE